MARRIKTHIRAVKLRRWFPSDDPLAVCVARLCILREDCFLEMRGFEATEISPLDANSDKWRRLYFFRSMIRTLFEIRSTLETLQRLKDFKTMLRRQTKSKQAEFGRLVRQFNTAHGLIKQIRNALGAHVRHENVERALNEMSYEREGMLEAGKKLGDTHYKFAAELIVAILLVGVPDNQQDAKIERDFRTIAGLFPAFPLIDDIIAMYAENKALI